MSSQFAILHKVNWRCRKNISHLLKTMVELCVCLSYYVDGFLYFTSKQDEKRRKSYNSKISDLGVGHNWDWFGFFLPHLYKITPKCSFLMAKDNLQCVKFSVSLPHSLGIKGIRVCIKEYYSALKGKESLTQATLWMNLEDIVLREISEWRKDRSCETPFIRGAYK